MTPTKVTLEVTEKGWTWSVWGGEQLLASQQMKRCKGGAESAEKASVFAEAMENWPQLLEEIESEDPLHIMFELEAM